jgi:hypothetical protein
MKLKEVNFKKYIKDGKKLWDVILIKIMDTIQI